MADPRKATMEVRLTDELGRVLTLTAVTRPGKPISEVMDGVLLDQAEGRITILELEFHPGSVEEPRRV